jgi:hypothetical protein
VPAAVKGLDLARSLYAEVVSPLLDVPHTACLIGEGSEVLGYDTERSRDHEWGPRLQVFTNADDVDAVRKLIDSSLPESHRGHPTRWFSLSAGHISHHIEVDTTEGWLRTRLPTIVLDQPDTAAWLATPQQHLLQLTAGAVFRDDLGELSRLRRSYSWYPPDIWRWMIATQWHRIGTTEPLLARTIELGDDRGARLLTGRIGRLIMEMAYLQERRYQPYDKWFGRGFADLAAAADLGPLIDAAMSERPTISSSGPLQQALLRLAVQHNALGMHEPITPRIADFAVNVNEAVRPYPVLNTAAFIDATVAAITDPGLRDLPRVGAIDQHIQVDDLVINFTDWPDSLADCYRAMLARNPTPGEHGPIDQ